MTSLVVDATYEKGVLRLDRPLPLGENERVRITVQSGLSLAEQTAGLMGWKGPAELVPTPAARSPLRVDPPIIPEEWEMVDIVLNVPPSPNATTLKARLGRRPLPDPPIIPTDDFE